MAAYKYCLKLMLLNYTTIIRSVTQSHPRINIPFFLRERSFLVEQIVTFRAELEKILKILGANLLPQVQSLLSSDHHRTWGIFYKSQIDFIQTLFGNRLKFIMRRRLL